MDLKSSIARRFRSRGRDRWTVDFIRLEGFATHRHRPRDASRVRLLFLLALLIAAAIGLGGGATAASPPPVVSFGSITLAHPLHPGGSSQLEVTARIAPGWHINSNRPLDPAYIATRLEIAAPAEIVAQAPIFPPAEVKPLKFSSGEKLAIFSGDLKVRVPVAATAAFRASVGAPAQIKLDYQACNDVQCLRPSSIEITFDLASAVATEAGGSGAGGTASGAAGPSGTSRGAAGASGAADGSHDFIAGVFARYGFLFGFIAVFLGGMALNLTPCVYPLIGVTIAYFGNESGGPRKVVILALLYVLGIALMFSSVGVAVALSGGLFGAAMQNPWVLATIAGVLFLLAGSSFGLYSLQPPRWLMNRAGTARPGYAGALLMGLGMGVVAAPCIGPIVLGLLLMVQRSGSAVFGFALFFTLAIGLGLPYVALAIAAGSIRRLPRSGEWLGWIEQLFGFVLVGLALYFLDPIVPDGIISRALPFYAAATGIYLGFITSRGKSWRPFMAVRALIGVVAVVALVVMLFDLRAKPPQTLIFAPFDDATLAKAREAGRPVVVDFSADWCVPCREMEHTTFTDPAVIRAAAGFVLMRANLTAKDKQNDALMRRFKVEGVPTSLFIDASGRVRERRVGYVGPADFVKYLHETG
jgi:thiol:disulfide interchange protein DsbD